MVVNSVSLAYCYGCRNAGDFAINQGSIELLSRTLPDADFAGVSRFSEESEEFHRLVEAFDRTCVPDQLFGGPVTYDPKSQSRVEQLFSLVGSGVRYGADMTGFADDASFHSTLYRQIANSDLLLFNGGNAIHYSPSHQSIAYLLAILYPLHVARRTQTPYAILPQTIFGLEGLGKRLVVPILNDAEFVMTRDDETFRYLSNFGLETSLINSLDTAFLNGTPDASGTETNEPSRIAAVPRFSTLGDTGELGDTVERMEHTFLNTLESMAEEGHDVTLTVQTEMDARWAADNRDRIAAMGLNYVEDYDPQALRDHYRQMDLLVTMRLHAGIFALSVGTPTVGVYRPEWGPKMPGTFETLDIGTYAMTWEEASEETLRTAMIDALDEADTLSDHIASNVDVRNKQMASDFATAVKHVSQ